jgi:demethylmenaquinone methyltransferase / 2-methoxy-6-polyprenyl-1,4-benzoquinol methylase
MFASIAGRYDFLNHFLSLSIDRYWRRAVVRVIAAEKPSSSDLCLDLCTGTGDLALAISRRLRLNTFGVDFCPPMLGRFAEKVRPGDRVAMAVSDVEQLPFHDGAFRFATIAFGLRNVERRAVALREAQRVLEPGGLLMVLEFSRPVLPVIRQAFNAYFHRVLPTLGAWISGIEGPYAYLPVSVSRFPDQAALAGELRAAGFAAVGYRNLTTGIAALHHARKPPASRGSPPGPVWPQ